MKKSEAKYFNATFMSVQGLIKDLWKEYNGEVPGKHLDAERFYNYMATEISKKLTELNVILNPEHPSKLN